MTNRESLLPTYHKIRNRFVKYTSAQQGIINPGVAITKVDDNMTYLKSICSGQIFAYHHYSELHGDIYLDIDLLCEVLFPGERCCFYFRYFSVTKEVSIEVLRDQSIAEMLAIS